MSSWVPCPTLYSGVVFGKYPSNRWFFMFTAWSEITERFGTRGSRENIWNRINIDRPDLGQGEMKTYI